MIAMSIDWRIRSPSKRDFEDLDETMHTLGFQARQMHVPHARMQSTRDVGLSDICTRPPKEHDLSHRAILVIMSPAANPAQHIIGYADPLVVSPSERLGVQVSCHRPSYSSRLVRLGPGHDHPNAPPPSHQAIESVAAAVHPGRPQFSRPGSFATVPWFVSSSPATADHMLALAISF